MGRFRIKKEMLLIDVVNYITLMNFKTETHAALAGESITLANWHKGLVHQNIKQVRSILKNYNINVDRSHEIFCEAFVTAKGAAVPAW